jgi:hypothetical protein
MNIGHIDTGALRFPGRAGRLQNEGATAALVAELGDNYARYHPFLNAEFTRLGGRPDPDAFTEAAAYLEAYERVREVAAAEALLRNCRAFRERGRALDAALDPAAPLIDEAGRLVGL